MSSEYLWYIVTCCVAIHFQHSLSNKLSVVLLYTRPVDLFTWNEVEWLLPTLWSNNHTLLICKVVTTNYSMVTLLE